jgi:excisionase family DNA binding protein
MTPAQLALRRAEVRLLERLERLEHQLDQGDAVWRGYCAAAAALAAIVPHTRPGADGRLLTTQELAAVMQVSAKTVLRKRRDGTLTAVQLGKRGRGALRWRADATAP